MAFLQYEQEVALQLLVTNTTIGLLLINERTLASVAITMFMKAKYRISFIVATTICLQYETVMDWNVK